MLRPLGLSSPHCQKIHQASTNFSQSWSRCSNESTSPSCPTNEASSTKDDSTGRQCTPLFKKYHESNSKVQQGRRLPGMPPLPIHPSLIFDLLPTDLVQSAQPQELLPAHCRPQEARRRTLLVLLPNLHPECLRGRHVLVPGVPNRRPQHHQDGI